MGARDLCPRQRGRVAVALIVGAACLLLFAALQAWSPTTIAAKHAQNGLLGTNYRSTSVFGKVTPRHYPGLFKSWSAVADREAGEIKAGISREDAKFEGAVKNFNDGFPKYFPAPSGQDVVFCMVEKVGSTRWKRLLYRQLDPGYSTDMDVHNSQMPWYYNLTKADMAEKIVDPSAVRFMWVRNPYSRLLSAFLDKAVNPPQEWADRRLAQFNGPYWDSPEEFKRFISTLMSQKRNHEKINPHFSPQSGHCGLPAGMGYDFYLKVEEMADWYADLIHLLGMQDAVSSGWGSEFAIPGTSSDVPDCFYPLPGTTCTETASILRDRVRGNHDTATRRSQRAQSESRPAAWLNSITSLHSHGADLQIRRYYTTPEIVALATEYLREDLDAFEYPELAIPA